MRGARAIFRAALRDRSFTKGRPKGGGKGKSGGKGKPSFDAASSSVSAPHASGAATRLPCFDCGQSGHISGSPLCPRPTTESGGKGKGRSRGGKPGKNRDKGMFKLLPASWALAGLAANMSVFPAQPRAPVLDFDGASASSTSSEEFLPLADTEPFGLDP